MSAITRRRFLEYGAGAGAGMVLWRSGRGQAFAHEPAVGMLDPRSIPQYETPLVIPPAMPRTSTIARRGRPGASIITKSPCVSSPSTFSRRGCAFCRRRCGATAPSTTPGRSAIRRHPIEARAGRPSRVKWINGLMDGDRRYLPHLLPVDQTLHWANPPGGQNGRDGRGSSPTPYAGPVPRCLTCTAPTLRIHSDGYAEARGLRRRTFLLATPAPGHGTNTSRSDSNGSTA